MSKGLLRRDGEMRDLCLMSLCQRLTRNHGASLSVIFLSFSGKENCQSSTVPSSLKARTQCVSSFSCSLLIYQEGQFAPNYHYSLLTQNRAQT